MNLENDLDLFDCLKLVEQSVSLLGQAKVSLSYSCRLAVLFRLTGDLKKAKKLISKQETSLTKSHKTLFGKTFYKALRTATKIRKYTKEISHHITGSTTQPPARSYRGRKNLKQYSKSSQPFRQNISEERVQPTEDTQKASQLNSGSKREHLNQKGQLQIETKTLDISLQIVPKDIYPALTKLSLGS